jgi:hypothetical protein
VLEFSYGGAFSSQTRYVADGVRACREIGEPRKFRDGSTRYPVTQQLQVVPPPERWTAFWQTVNRLEVAHWKRQYSSTDVGERIYDGTQWWLTESTLHHALQSEGDNAYPTMGHPKRTTTDDAVFEELRKAFEALLKVSNP